MADGERCLNCGFTEGMHDTDLRLAEKPRSMSAKEWEEKLAKLLSCKGFVSPRKKR